MKDTIVTARRKKTELITLLVCFVVSNLLSSLCNYCLSCIIYGDDNVYFLYHYIYFVLYAFWGILRLLFYGIQALFKKKNLININENK